MTRKRKNYFWTEETDKAISLYVTEKDHYMRNRIYNDHIYEALTKTASGVLTTINFPYPFSERQEIIHDCTAYMTEALHKWDPEKRTKAFSYFSVIARNFFLNDIKRRTKLIRRNHWNTSLDDQDIDPQSRQRLTEIMTDINNPETIMISDEKSNRLRDRMVVWMMRYKRSLHVSPENRELCDRVATILQEEDIIIPGINPRDIVNLMMKFDSMKDVNKKDLARLFRCLKKFYDDNNLSNSNI